MKKSKVDWSKLKPQEIWDVLEDLPNVAGPWEKSLLDLGAQKRPDIRNRYGEDGAVIIYKRDEYWGVEINRAWLTNDDGSVLWFKSLKAAKKAADEALEAEGWLLV